MASKRPAEDSIDSENKRKPKLDNRSKCFFGQKCYRRNPDHFKEFSHSHLENMKSIPEDASKVLKDQWQILKDLNLLNASNEVSKGASNSRDDKKSNLSEALHSKGC